MRCLSGCLILWPLAAPAAWGGAKPSVSVNQSGKMSACLHSDNVSVGTGGKGPNAKVKTKKKGRGKMGKGKVSGNIGTKGAGVNVKSGNGAVRMGANGPSTFVRLGGGCFRIGVGRDGLRFGF